MSWSYNPGASTRDWVRFRIGDTDTTDQLLSDEEINAALSDEGNQYAAAAVCAEAIAGTFAREADKSVGPLSISASQKAAMYAKLAQRLRAQVGRKVAPWLGGRSQDDVDTAKADTDRVDPAFEVGQWDLPGSADTEDTLSDSFK